MSDFDIVIIGAGIHGAGVAQAAAACGLRVLVAERNSAAGMETSSASSKLIHGGLRYLETAQFRLVRECLRERHLLLQNAAHLVSLQPFYIPVYRGAARSAYWIAAGLTLYKVLSGGGLRPDVCGPPIDYQHQGLRTEGLIRIFRYYDAQTDDQALTRAVLASAQSLGAQVKFDSELIAAESGDTYRVSLSGGEIVSCRALVNATGPWVNQTAQRIPGAPLLPVDWVQGTHIVLDVPAQRGCLYVESPRDRRAVFILPWRGKTMVGTTETALTSPEKVAPDAEIAYLLEAYNHYFPDSAKGAADVSCSFSGIRVLPKESTGANQRSRETLFTEESKGPIKYLGIYGGKLTSYRATAETVLKRLAPAIRTTSEERRRTRTIRL